MNNSNFNPFQSQPKQRQMPIAGDSILESIRGVGGDVGKTLVKDVAGKVGADAVSSLFGAPVQSGELHMNQEIVFNKEQNNPPHAHAERAPSRAPIQLVEKGIEQKIDAIRQELQAISQSMKALNTEIQRAVTEVPIDPGVYHLNFYERLRSVLVILRTQIEDSRSWLALSTSRRKKKGYWSLYKKHGTKFGLSAERTLATSAG